MKKFIVKICLISILLIAFPLICNWVYSLILRNKISEISKGKSTLILGDSHTEYAINDNFLNNSLNLSHSADSYVYSLVKLRLAKELNKEFDTLVLALSNHNLLTIYDQKWLFNDINIQSKFRKHLPLFNRNELMLFLLNEEKSVISSFLKTPKTLFKSIWSENVQEWGFGGYQFSNRSKLSEDIDRLINENINRDITYSKYELNFLNQIVSYCKQNDIYLIFISTPIHSSYFYKKNSITEFNKLYRFLDNTYPEIKFLDYSKHKFPDKYFQDVDHLNSMGAKVFSLKLEKELKKI